MTKHTLLLFFLLYQTLLQAQPLTNETAEPMLCESIQRAEYAEEEIHGIVQLVQTRRESQHVTVLAPGKAIEQRGNGSTKCYNRLMKLEAYGDTDVRKSNARMLKTHVANHEMFDIGSYVNEDRAFVETRYGTLQRCQPYDGGQYCNKANGLDILFSPDGRVAKLFIYGYALQNGRLPFAPEAMNELRANGELLGLWVSEKNMALTKKTPDLRTTNVIVWNAPAPYIKRIVMTSQDGHLPIGRYRRGRTGAPEALVNALGAIEIDYVLDDAAYAAHQKSKPAVDAAMTADGLPVVPRKAGSTWGEYLNPKGTVPKNRFQAFYINTKEPQKVIASETVDKVSVNYPYDKFHGIKSEDFGGYWVGNFSYDKETPLQIGVSQSWSKTRIIIDGTVVYEGGGNARVPYTFAKGKHRVEIEYINNWHTTGFMVTIAPEKKTYGAAEIKRLLAEHTSKQSKVLYAGVYESRNKEQTVTLKLAKSTVPVVLVLSSYDAVEWIVKNPHRVKIEAVVYGAYKPGVEVEGDLPKGTPVWAAESRFGSYSFEERCSCHGAHFHCEGSNGLDVVEGIEAMTGKTVLGVSGLYGADALSLPAEPVTQAWREAKRKEKSAIEAQRDACQKEQNPSFEKMF